MRFLTNYAKLQNRRISEALFLDAHEQSVHYACVPNFILAYKYNGQTVNVAATLFISFSSTFEGASL